MKWWHNVSLFEALTIVSIIVAIMTGVETLLKKQGLGFLIVRRVKGWVMFPGRVLSELAAIRIQVETKWQEHLNTLHTIQDEQKKNSRAVREINTYLHLAEEMDHCLKFKVDTTGACTFANRALLHFFGFSFSDLAGFNWEDVIIPADRERVKTKWRKCIKTRSEFFDLHQIQGSNGTHYASTVRGLPIIIDNIFEGYYGTITVEDVPAETKEKPC